MKTSNRKRVEVAALPHCADFRPRHVGGDRADEIVRVLPRLAPVLVFTITAALVALATNLSMHLLNLRMQNLGATETAIGLSVAAQASGIILIAPFAKKVIARLGLRMTFMLGVLVTSGTLLMFGFVGGIMALTMLRLVFATGLALLFTLSESLVIAATDGSNRGQVIGWYATSLAVGTAAGPALVILTGVEGFLPIGCAAALFVLTALPILAYVKRGDQLVPVTRAPTFAAFRIVPIAMLTAFVFGVVDNGGLSMLSVYAAQNGYGNSQAATFAAVALVGAIALQLPLGYLANKYEPKMALLVTGVAAAAILAVLPNAMGVQALAWCLVFVLGGLLDGLYTIGLFCIAKYCRGIGIAAANGCFISMCGFGEFVGPLATGTSTYYAGTQGFGMALTVLLACYVVGLVCLGQNKPAETRKDLPSGDASAPSLAAATR
jgi:MFS family permease